MDKKELKKYLKKEIVVCRRLAKDCQENKLLYAKGMWLGKVIAFKEIIKKLKLGK